MVNFGDYMAITMIDWEGHTSLMLFFNGCKRRCSYCQNTDFLDAINMIPVENIYDLIDKTRWNNIVISGGECTDQPKALYEIARYSKSVGKNVAVETNGSNPEIIKTLVDENLVDMVFCDFNILEAPLQLEETIWNARDRVELRFTIFNWMIDERIARMISLCLPNFISGGLVLQQGIPTDRYKHKSPGLRQLREFAESIETELPVFTRTRNWGLKKVDTKIVSVPMNNLWNVRNYE